MSKFIMLFLGIVLSLEIQAQSFKTARDYNDYIVTQQTMIGEQIVKFNEVMGKDDATKASIQPYYDELISVTKLAISNLSKMPAYEKNVALRDEALNLLKFYERTFTIDYKKMIELVFSENLDEATITEINRLLEKVTNEEKPFDEKFAAAQAAFAKLHGFELIENELQDELDKE